MSAGQQCTLAEYAAATQLPEHFLADLGLRQVKRAGRSAIQVPYRSAIGEASGVAYCLVAPGEPSRPDGWERKETLPPYGLETLIDEPEDLYLVEGEVGAQTLLFHGLPAIGLPPGIGWRTAWSTLMDSVPNLFLVVGQREGTETVPRWLSEVPFRERVKVVELPDGATINALHQMTGRHFVEAWRSHTSTAVAWPALEHRQIVRRHQEARDRCAGLLAHDDLLGAFEVALRQSGHAGDLSPGKLLFLAVISRLLESPVSVAIKGPSSAGKSFLVKQVLRFFPADAFHAMTAMSDRALIYSDEPLKHRMLVLYEADGLSDTGSLIVRSLLSEGHVVYETVIDMQGERIEREGPTGLITTTTRVSMHPENETRLLSITIPDAPERITAVLVAIADEREADGADVGQWHALQEFIGCSDRRVVVPFGRTLAVNIPPVSVRLQRDFKALLSLVRAHALLHQETRERDLEGRLVATLGDYAAVRELVHELMSEGAERRVPPTVRDTVAAMVAMGPASRPDGDGLTVVSVAGKLGIDRSSASRRLKRAASLGYVAETTGSRSGRTKRWIIGERLVNEDVEILPSPEALEDLCNRARTSQEDADENGHPR